MTADRNYGKNENVVRSGDHSGFAEMLGEARLHRLARNHCQRQGGLAMGTFGAETADVPARFAASGAAIDNIEMVKRLIAALMPLSGQCMSRLIDE